MTQQINLLEPSLLPQREWFTGRTIVITLTLATAALAAHWWAEHSAMRQLLASSSTAPEAADPSASAPLDEVGQQLAQHQSRLARNELLMQAVAGLTDLPRNNAQRLRELVAALPETAWLQGVEFVGERGVRIVGGSTRAETLAGLAQRLNEIPAYRGVPLQVYALAQNEPEARSAEPAGSAPRAPAPLHYGFVLSSVSNEALKGAAR
jgi:MSHA biogenesis protein MshI